MRSIGIGGDLGYAESSIALGEFELVQLENVNAGIVEQLR